MPETATQTTETTQQANTENQTVKATPASLGKVEKLPNTFNSNTANNSLNSNVGAKATQDANTGVEDGKGDATSNAGTAGAGTASTPAPTEEQIKDFFKEKGIDYEGIDKLKEKLTPATAPTEQQIKDAALAHEKRLVDIWVKGQGTVEQYVAIKALAESDPAEISMSALKKELKEAKFDDDQIAEIIKERYFQIEDAEIEQYENDSDKEIAKKKKEYGAKKLANRGLNTQKQAKEILYGLKKAAESEDLQEQEEKTISSNIDEHFQKVPRKYAVEIGEIDGSPITPVDYTVSDTTEKELSKFVADLKNPEKRNNILYTPEGKLNITKISDLFAENIILKSQLKAVFHESATRTNAQWEKVFPARSAQELGIGNNGSKDKTSDKKPASFGKPQRIQRGQNN